MDFSHLSNGIRILHDIFNITIVDKFNNYAVICIYLHAYLHIYTYQQLTNNEVNSCRFF